MSNYEKRPIAGSGDPAACAAGWDAIASALRGARVVLLDTQPAVLPEAVEEILRRLSPDLVVDTAGLFLSAPEIAAMLDPELSDDPVFGRLSRRELREFMDPEKVEGARRRVGEATGRVLVHGPGAALVIGEGLLIMAEVPRWETQLRQRAHRIENLGLRNREERPALQYKRSYFVDWRVWDRHKRALSERVDFMLDTTVEGRPLMVTAEGLRSALTMVARRPFRVVPYFDPAPWGGQWMKEACDLERDVANWGWCFDCVPEENSLLLAFGDTVFETPAANLVYERPVDLLGDAVFGRFGAEFPIRFDFLDTVGGGNLSLQVHPLTEYIEQKFGLSYTQDESYYMLDATDSATVFLGLREGIDPAAMEADLRRAQEGDVSFPAERYVNRFPARRHDHFLIPAGTVHCSGAGGMVLEISATPYIFTFKLWDWDRLGLDGRPRPIHIDHGLANIQWDRDTVYARERLVNRVTQLGAGEGWVEERTGLHEAEFIETRRHWFTAPVPHHTSGGVNVLNLVEGEAAIVESPHGAFEPVEVHYAETFIVPAAVGPYVIRPAAGTERMATIKAYVR